MESGELDYFVEELVNLSPGKMATSDSETIGASLSLASLRIESMNDLAQKTHRNIKNVYEDLHVLKSLGLIVFKKRGKRNIVPETLVEELAFLVR